MKLSSLDIITLENYHFVSDEFTASRRNRLENRELLCVTKSGLNTVQRKDVTCWELLKRFFGCGKLAGCDLRLTSISRYLEDRDLAHLSQEHPAYRTIHAIATRMLVYRKAGQDVPNLWKKLATTTHELTITYYTTWHSRPNGRTPVAKDRDVSVRKRMFFLTPRTTVGHLKAQAELEAREKTPLAASAPLDATPVDAHLLSRLRFRAKVSDEYAHWYSNYYHTHPVVLGSPHRFLHRW